MPLDDHLLSQILVFPYHPSDTFVLSLFQPLYPPLLLHAFSQAMHLKSQINEIFLLSVLFCLLPQLTCGLINPFLCTLQVYLPHFYQELQSNQNFTTVLLNSALQRAGVLISHIWWHINIELNKAIARLFPPKPSSWALRSGARTPTPSEPGFHPSSSFTTSTLSKYPTFDILLQTHFLILHTPKTTNPQLQTVPSQAPHKNAGKWATTTKQSNVKIS